MVKKKKKIEKSEKKDLHILRNKDIMARMSAKGMKRQIAHWPVR